MTMWLSGKIEKPGIIQINHIQRGFPLKEIFPEFRNKANLLRKAIKTDILKKLSSSKYKINKKKLLPSIKWK